MFCNFKWYNGTSSRFDSYLGTLSYVCDPRDPDPRVYGPCMSGCDHCDNDIDGDGSEGSGVIKETNGKFLVIIGVRIVCMYPYNEACLFECKSLYTYIPMVGNYLLFTS